MAEVGAAGRRSARPSAHWARVTATSRPTATATPCGSVFMTIPFLFRRGTGRRQGARAYVRPPVSSVSSAVTRETRVVTCVSLLRAHLACARAHAHMHARTPAHIRTGKRETGETH